MIRSWLHRIFRRKPKPAAWAIVTFGDGSQMRIPLVTVSMMDITPHDDNESSID